MKLWTIQHMPFWKRLEVAGRICADAELVKTTGFCAVDKRMQHAYDWLAAQMDGKIGRPTPDAMPLWAWLQWSGARRRPDLRSAGHLSSGEEGVRIEFEIDDRDVVLSDFELWHFALNYGYIANSEEDDEAFDAELAKSGDRYAVPLPDAAIHEKIVRSWDRIFDLEWENHYYHEAGDERSIQATFWELDLQAVRQVKEFTAR